MSDRIFSMNGALTGALTGTVAGSLVGTSGGGARGGVVNLKFYAAELPFASLAVGVDNIHHDVFLSTPWCDQTRAWLMELVRHTANVSFGVQTGMPGALQGMQTGTSPTSSGTLQPGLSGNISGGGARGGRVPGASAYSGQLIASGSSSHVAGHSGSGRAGGVVDTAAWKRLTLELLQGSLTRAKYEKKIEMDLLARVAVIKFLTAEIGAQFATLMLEAKEWIRQRGDAFERSEQAHVMKAGLSELQAGRRNIYRAVGQQVFQALADLEDNHLGRSRRALFGDEQSGAYELLRNPLAFVEGGRDDGLFLDHYVLLGNYQKDQDRIEVLSESLLEFVREVVLSAEQGGELNEATRMHQALTDAAREARSEVAQLEDERDVLTRRLQRKSGALATLALGAPTMPKLQAELTRVEYRLAQAQKTLADLTPRIEAAKAKADFLAGEYESVLAGYLDEPENAARLFDPAWPGDPANAAQRAQLLDSWVSRLDARGLLIHILASYELRDLYRDYCPPVHLQQLKKALVWPEERERVAAILRQFPARKFSLEPIERVAKRLRRYPREESRAVVTRFAADFMRLRRDLRNYDRLAAAMEKLQLVRSERTREISRMNSTLYEFLLASEARPEHDSVVSHAVIKADVRGSTRITHDLLSRGLNPATLFSLNFYEPVKKILDRYNAAKVFIEGDAMVLAIFETESNRATQRAVSKACALARQILAVSAAYNERPDASDLPRLELGVGIAFQGGAPAYWVDGDSRIMISRALNLSDRLSSCSKAARRLLGQKAASAFRLFVFQAGMEGAEEDEADEFLIRFNLNGVELNEEGFQKLSEEIALQSVKADCEMPWGCERTTFFFGEAPVGEGLEPLLLRRGFVRQLHSDGGIGAPSKRAYYEVCTDPRAFELVEALLVAAGARGR